MLYRPSNTREGHQKTIGKDEKTAWEKRRPQATARTIRLGCLLLLRLRESANSRQGASNTPRPTKQPLEKTAAASAPSC
jgi:hypothetical protein